MVSFNSDQSIIASVITAITTLITVVLGLILKAKSKEMSSLETGWTNLMEANSAFKDELNEHIKLLKEENKQLKDQLYAMDQKLEDVRLVNTELKTSKNSLTRAIKDLKEENEALKKKLSEQEVKINRIQK